MQIHIPGTLNEVYDLDIAFISFDNVGLVTGRTSSPQNINAIYLPKVLFKHMKRKTTKGNWLIQVQMEISY